MDHPRVCGEKPKFVHNFVHKLGSPPRVRGKGVVHSERQRGGGITPACAGKSLSLHLSSRSFQDHPRVCGEKVHHAGLSPDS